MLVTHILNAESRKENNQQYYYMYDVLSDYKSMQELDKMRCNFEIAKLTSYSDGRQT
jgi:hypothetical protein